MKDFYVYELLDPLTKVPFYVGKGTGNRAFSHINSTKITNQYKHNKIQSIKAKGLIPEVRIVEYYEHEDQAYDAEKILIAFYGRKGYEEKGILTNVCEDNRPPNLKGMSYKEIYGDRAESIIEKKRQLQIDAGGYGPSNHTSATKQKISDSVTGINNPMYGRTHSKETIEKMSKAKIGKYDGKSNPNAKKYLVTSPTQEEHIIVGGLKQFCIDRGFSYATMRKIQNTGNTATRGPLKGWLIREII